MRSAHWRWACRGILVSRAIQQWSRHLHPRKWQGDQQGDHAPPTIGGLGLDYVWRL